MASEERLRELEDKYEGYTVYDNRGDKIGKVDDLFIDEADREEYIGVKMGFLGRKSTLIPMDIIRVNEADRTVEVSESKDHVKNAPSFDDDEDITPDYENRIRTHFGLQTHESATSRGSYGSPSGAAGAAEEDRRSDEAYSDRDQSTQGEPASGESSAPDTDDEDRTGSTSGSPETAAGERTSSSTDAGGSAASVGAAGGAFGGAASRFERGRSTEGTGGTASSAGEATTSGASRPGQTEETETVEEGGRPKVRRRIIREEIIEEDA